jgi:two-component system, NarL family, sensor kinase
MLTGLKHYKQLIFGVWFLLMPFILSSQNRIIDSLENKLKLATHDSSRWDIFFRLAKAYYGYDTAKALSYQEKGYSIIKKLDDDYALARYYDSKFSYAFGSSNYLAALSYIDSAIFLYKRAIKNSQSEVIIKKSKFAIVGCGSDRGIVYNKLGKNDSAVIYFIAYINALEASNDRTKNEGIATAYNNIASCYYDLKNFAKAVEYDKASIDYRLRDNNEEMVAVSYIFVSDDFDNLQQFDSAFFYLNKAKPIVEKFKKNSLNVHYFDIVAQTFRLKGDYEKAIAAYTQLIEETKKVNDAFQIMRCHKMIGICYAGLKDYNNARKFFLLALPVAAEKNSPKERIEILQELVTVEEKSADIGKAFIYLKQLNVIKDSLKNDEINKTIAELDTKYQSERKEKEIVSLAKDKKIQGLSIRQKSTLNYILAGSLVGLLITGFLVYRSIRQRQLLIKKETELQQQRIRELEKDRQLVAVDSMLKGQEEERSRLAKDLHDGLGGLLSGVKFSLSNMKDNLVVTPENMAVFERSLDMIDTSIRELRRVAHNMMPEILTKFGLDEAVKEYCNTINATKLITVKYQSHGMETRIDNATEIIIYRIVQELLNNILKHAGSSEAFVQLIKENHRLNVVVEDNGKGFDKGLSENNKGVGLANIRSRVEYLKGQLDIHSEQGKGTLVNIEFNL